MTTERPASLLFWCLTCGIVWSDTAPPLCRHMVVDGPPARRMEPLPPWHPYARADG